MTNSGYHSCLLGVGQYPPFEAHLNQTLSLLNQHLSSHQPWLVAHQIVRKPERAGLQAATGRRKKQAPYGLLDSPEVDNSLCDGLWVTLLQRKLSQQVAHRTESSPYPAPNLYLDSSSTWHFLCQKATALCLKWTSSRLIGPFLPVSPAVQHPSNFAPKLGLILQPQEVASRARANSGFLLQILTGTWLL